MLTQHPSVVSMSVYCSVCGRITTSLNGTRYLKCPFKCTGKLVRKTVVEKPIAFIKAVNGNSYFIYTVYKNSSVHKHAHSGERMIVRYPRLIKDLVLLKREGYVISKDL